MPANNSKTNRSIRQRAALARFKISPSGPLREGRSEEQQASAVAAYVENKNAEKEALTKRVGRSSED